MNEDGEASVIHRNRFWHAIRMMSSVIAASSILIETQGQVAFGTDSIDLNTAADNLVSCLFC